jgi:hypothetical protein
VIVLSGSQALLTATAGMGKVPEDPSSPKHRALLGVHAQTPALHGAIPSALQHRIRLFDDKGQVWESLRSKSDTGQINEALCKVLCHNICVLIQEMHELGIEPAF